MSTSNSSLIQTATTNQGPGGGMQQRNFQQTKLGQKKSAKVLQPSLASSREMEEVKHHSIRQHARQNLFQPSQLNGQELMALGIPDPMAPNYETSTGVRYISSQRDCTTAGDSRTKLQGPPDSSSSRLQVDRPQGTSMFGRDSIGNSSGLGPNSSSVLPSVHATNQQNRAISPATNSTLQSQSSLMQPAALTTDQFYENHNMGNVGMVAQSQPKDHGAQIHKRQQQMHVILQSKSARLNQSNTQSSNNINQGGAVGSDLRKSTGQAITNTGKVKKLKVINKDAIKLINQDNSVRIKSAQGNYQVMSLVKQSSQSNATDLHRKALKIAKPSNTITLTKLKSQAVIVNKGGDSSLTFREMGTSSKNSFKQSLVKVSKQANMVSNGKSNTSFQAEAPLEEALPQLHITSSVHEDTRHGDAFKMQHEERVRHAKEFLSVKDLTNDVEAGNTVSRVKACGITNNKDSSNFNDIEEKVQQEIAPGEDDSGWFTTKPSACSMTKTPDKGVIESAIDSNSQLYEASHTRIVTSSTEIKALQQQSSLYIDQTMDDEDPIIKRIPDSDISQKSRHIGKGRNLHHQGEVKGNSRVSLPSERISEMTDDQIVERNTLTLQSHESLRSNESKNSMKNVFSQSQRITNIAARYIHVQDDNQNGNFQLMDSINKDLPAEMLKQSSVGRKVASALDDKSTPRFNRQILKSSAKSKMRKKKSTEGGQIFTDSLYREKSQKFDTMSWQKSTNSGGQSNQVSHRHHVPTNEHKLKSGLRSVRVQDDELSGTQDENSISSMTQQKDMKSLLGILQRHNQKQHEQSQSNLDRSNQSNLSKQNQQRKKTKIQISSKLSENLYNAQEQTNSSQQESMMLKSITAPTLPLTPNSAGNTAAAHGQGFGSSNSQQSRSFNIGMQQILQAQNSKKKLQTTKQSTVSQYKQQTGIMKHTVSRALQQKQGISSQNIPYKAANQKFNLLDQRQSKIQPT